MPCRKILFKDSAQLSDIKGWLEERRDPGMDVDDKVLSILADIGKRGDEAVIEYTRRFDCPDFGSHHLKVSEDAIAAAAEEIPASDLEILKEAAANIRVFHERQKQNSWMTTSEDGTVLGQLVKPVDRVGLYVPGGVGGETPLISSLLMNAIPAQVAGVSGIAVVSPPRKDGTLNPHILAAAHILGITEIYACGSAWAIAALAYGTDSIAPVDVIAGPGNIFVTTAKRLLIGRVGIDMIAGPSEIAILADATANPDHLAADLLSQAEHDPLAACILVTTSETLAEETGKAVEKRLADLPRNEIARKALADWGAVITVTDLDTGIEVVNAIAPEHLEIVAEKGWEILGKIRHAGAIFLGPNSPEPVGDYFAGPNHVLPTMSTARFSSALSVETFTKKTSLIAASPEFIANNADKIARLARLEGLEAHARSAECRK